MLNWLAQRLSSPRTLLCAASAIKSRYADHCRVIEATKKRENAVIAGYDAGLIPHYVTGFVKLCQSACRVIVVVQSLCWFIGSEGAALTFVFRSEAAIIPGALV